MAPVTPAGAQVQQYGFMLLTGEVKGMLVKFLPLNALAASLIYAAAEKENYDIPVKHGIVLQAYTG
jgi:hypothetical protein